MIQENMASFEYQKVYAAVQINNINKGTLASKLECMKSVIFKVVWFHKFYFSLYYSLLRFLLFYFNFTNLLYNSSLSMALNSAMDCCILILKFFVSFSIAFSLFSLHFLMEIKSSLQYLVNMNISDNF